MKPHILIPALLCAAVVIAARAAIAAYGIYIITEHLIIHRRAS